jgi:hypothetical protein
MVKRMRKPLGEGLQQWPGQLADGAAQRADGAVQRADGGRIEGEEPWILRGAITSCCAGRPRCSTGSVLVLRCQLGLTGLTGLSRWA